ncbi:hypothetical protein GCM10023115_01610 [Pontixanthobacter gangjinensis]|uniref:TadE-like domain-containing protein n=1 Tax=Pontixanthobacter gangjinensis TaxID=1028742 RepID=A0A6I4SJR9_9SPHN|nr:TadE/TadG family type IV pilus assembly protein [Pontixanthobacter gangjinensis]MXO55416.1 hypothetical protein [Pontixanthobacter gangjinensis]
MMRAFTSILRKDARGGAIIEFALVAPLLIVMLLATMNLGIYYFAQNSIDNAIDEAARKATVYPTPSDTALTTVFNEAILKGEKTGTINFTIAKGATASGVDYMTLTAAYSVRMNLVFTDLGSIPVRSERRVYLNN